MAKRFDVVFFDVGYTLLYYEPPLPELILRVFRDAGIDASPTALWKAQVRVEAEFARDNATATFEATEAADNARELAMRRSILARLGIHDEETLRRFCAREEALFEEPGVMRLFPEVPGVLARLRSEGFRLGIISNWSWDLRHRCDQVGLTESFDYILASAYAGCLKPNPCIFQRALADMQVQAARAIHIGDDYKADVLGATGAGMEAVWVSRDPSAPGQPCRTVRDLTELFSILEG